MFWSTQAYNCKSVKEKVQNEHKINTRVMDLPIHSRRQS